MVFILGVMAFTTTNADAGTVAAESAVINDSSNFTRIEGLIETGAGSGFDTTDLYTAAGGTGGTYQPALARQVVAGMVEAGDGGGIGAAMAAAEYLPIAVVAGSALVMGWQVGGSIDHWLGISSHFGALTSFPASTYVSGDWASIRCNSGSSAVPGNGTANWNDAGGNVRWSNVIGSTNGSAFGASGDCADAIATYALSPPFVLWMGVLQRPQSTCTGGNIGSPLQCTWDNNFSCTAPCTLGGSTDANMRTQMQLIRDNLGAANVRLYYRSGSDASCAADCKGQIYMTQAQMNRARAVTTPGGTTNPGGSATTVRTPVPATTPGTCTYGSSCGSQVRTIINNNTFTRKWIVHVLDPTTTPLDPAASNNFNPFQPNPNETYTDYITRLQAGGWVGTATTIVEPSTLPDYGPSAVTRVQYTGTDTVVHTLDPLQWPSTSPQMKTDTPITIRYNTPTATPGPTDQPNGTDCSTCAIDWSPIESLSFGTKFPFGVPSWLSTFFGTVTFADSCPTLSIGKPSALGGGSIDIPFCSAEWESTYRPIVFPILEALMTLAAITFLGAKIFGIGGGETE